MCADVVKKVIELCICFRCGHRWLPRKIRKPKLCPRCGSPLWDETKGKT